MNFILRIPYINNIIVTIQQMKSTKLSHPPEHRETLLAFRKRVRDRKRMLDKKKLKKDNFRIFKRLYNIDKNSSKNKYFRIKNNHEFSVDSVVNNKN